MSQEKEKMLLGGARKFSSRGGKSVRGGKIGGAEGVS